MPSGLVLVTPISSLVSSLWSFPGRWPARVRRLLVKVTALLCAATGPALAMDNLLSNGGFENGTSTWLDYGAGYFLTNAERHTGLTSSGRSTTSGENRGLYNSPAVPLTPNRTYRMRAFVKSSGTTVSGDNFASLTLSYYDVSYALVQNTVYVVQNQDWTSYSTDTTLPAVIHNETVYLYVYNGNGSTCNYWFDDFTLVGLPNVATGSQLTVAKDSSNAFPTTTLTAEKAVGSILTWSISSQGAHGTAAVTTPGADTVASVTYTPTGGYLPGDSFTVQVSDGTFTDTCVITVRQTKTWNGGGGDDNWSTALNWVGGVAPVAGDSLIFAATTRTTPNNDYTATTSFGSITFDPTAGAFTLGGNQITLAGDLTNNGATAQTVSLAMVDNATPTVNCASGNITITGIISGTGTLTKSGAGTLTLSGTNTYTCATTVSAGTLTNGAAGVIADTSTVTVASGATWNLANFNETVGSLAGAGSITLGSATVTCGGEGSSTTFSGVINGTGAVTKAGAGTMTLSGVNTYTGATTVSAGTLTNGAAGVIADTSAMTVASGATWNLANFNETVGSLAGAGSITLGSATVTCGGDGTTTTLSGVISGTGAVTKSGTGTLILQTATNTYSGGTTINAGTVQMGGSGDEVVTSLGSGLVTINTGGLLWLRPTGTFNTWNIANSFSLNGGTVREEDGYQHLATGGGATFTIGASGGTLQSTWGNKDLYIDGQLTGSGALGLGHGSTNSGQNANIHFTNGTNTYSGAITVTSGAGSNGVSLYDDATNALQYATVSLVSGGATPAMQISTANATTTIAGLSGSAGVVNTATSAGTYTLNVNNASNMGFTGVLQNNTGILALTKSGAGTLTLSGTNTHTGATTVSAGTLLVSGSTVAGSAVSVSSGATLGGTGTVAGTVALASGSTLAPGLGGTAIGTLTTGTVTCNATSILGLDLDGTTPTNDKVSTAGTVTCAGTLTIASISNAALAKAYTIVSAGTVSGTFSGLANNAVFSQAGRLFRIAYSSTTVTLTDCAPLITARQTRDADGDGHLDRISLTFDQTLNDNFTGLTVTVAGYAVTGFDTGTTANDAVIDVLLTPPASGDTGATPAVRITANTTLTQAGGTGVVQVEGSATAATDAAAPVLLAAAWTDGGTGGVSAGDTVTLTFSESVTATTMGVADIGLPVTSDTLSSTTIANQAGSTLTMTLAGSPRLTPGGVYGAAAIATGKPSGVFMVSGAHVQDAVGLTAATGTASSAVDLAPGTTTVAIAWASGGDPRAWAVGTLTVGAIANSLDSGVDLTVRDTGNCNVDLSIASAETAPSNWSPAASAGADAYLMKAGTSAAASGARTSPASYALTLTSSAQGLTNGLLSGTTSAYALYFQAPTSVSSGSATPQTIVITISAALAP